MVKVKQAMQKIRLFFQGSWFWFKLVLAVLLIIILIYLGVKSKGLIESVMSFFGIKKKPQQVKIKIQDIEKKDTGSNKTEQTKDFLEQLKRDYL